MDWNLYFTVAAAIGTFKAIDMVFDWIKCLHLVLTRKGY